MEKHFAKKLLNCFKRFTHVVQLKQIDLYRICVAWLVIQLSSFNKRQIIESRPVGVQVHICAMCIRILIVFQQMNILLYFDVLSKLFVVTFKHHFLSDYFNSVVSIQLDDHR